ncbi:hypothetical protein TanjilG_19310 [Lupinus angustifolius]|uniref:Fe2OG dioxygenase domain-containing protein n=1 Tax=Lupinus angustifolius TaxID=3871 RepID=A0A1J7GW36_LUPAN|nr:hypothetical protein TanjilG_19310 [Lupinus angustifolius]
MELAKQPYSEVPKRYVQLDQDPNFVSNAVSLPQVLVIDMNKLLSEDATELEKLDHACKQWGFFQMINHGVNPSLVENVKIGVQEFFNLPMEDKKKLWQKPGDLEGFEHVIGLHPHSDVEVITILHQVNEIEGLQIRKDGMWIPIKPLSYAFVINIGDILEILADGIYRNIEHRSTVIAILRC